MRSAVSSRRNADRLVMACALSAHPESESIDRVMRTSFWCARRTTAAVVLPFPSRAAGSTPTSQATNSIP